MHQKCVLVAWQRNLSAHKSLEPTSNHSTTLQKFLSAYAELYTWIPGLPF